MILKPAYACTVNDREAMVEHLAVEITQSNNQTATNLTPHMVREVAHGIAAYLDDNHPDGVRIESGQLLGLTSRALLAVGESGAARRVLLFGGGMARCTAWTVVGGEPMIVLDLGRFATGDSALLELSLIRTLDIVLDSVADLWDAAGGAGWLGLRNFRSIMAGGGRNRRADRKRHRALSAELIARCEQRLAHLRVARAWSATPQIMNLDPAE